MSTEKSTIIPFSDIKDTTPRVKVDSFFQKARSLMTPDQINSLPAETFLYVTGIVRFAINHLDELKPELVDLIKTLYEQQPQGERFIFDPVNHGSLTVDANGDVVTLINADVARLTENGPLGKKDDFYIKDYSEAKILTGPNKDKIILRDGRMATLIGVLPYTEAALGLS